nr:hypothetical protein [Tanacetum cinerariifolium]
MINERHMQSKEGKDTSSSLRNYFAHAVDANIRPANDQVPFDEDTSSSLRNYIAHAVDANIRPANDQVPFDEVNSQAKVQSPKSRNNIKPAKRIPNVNKPERWISKGYRWIPTGKMFTNSTTKVNDEPPNGLNDDITNPYEWDQTLKFQRLFDEYFNPPLHAVSPDLTAVAAPRVVDLAGSPSSTTIYQDVPSVSTSPTTHEIQSQVTHQDVEEQIHGH